jgi:hypothetical protein
MKKQKAFSFLGTMFLILVAIGMGFSCANSADEEEEERRSAVNSETPEKGVPVGKGPTGGAADQPTTVRPNLTLTPANGDSVTVTVKGVRRPVVTNAKEPVAIYLAAGQEVTIAGNYYYTVTSESGALVEVKVTYPEPKTRYHLYDVTKYDVTKYDDTKYYGIPINIDVGNIPNTPPPTVPTLVTDGVVEDSLEWLNGNDGYKNTGSRYTFTMPRGDPVKVDAFKSTSLAGMSFEIRLNAEGADEDDKPAAPDATDAPYGAEVIPYEAVAPYALGSGTTKSDNETALSYVKGLSGKPLSITVKDWDGVRRMLSLKDTGSMFRLGASSTGAAYVNMVIDNIILKGLSEESLYPAVPIPMPDGTDLQISIPASDPAINNTRPLVYVGKDSSFTMMGSSEITGNRNATSGAIGGGVCVDAGEFTMEGAKTLIHHNSSYNAYGGGVYVGNTGKFYMNGLEAEISSNAVTNVGGQRGGAGVSVVTGSFSTWRGTGQR